MAEEERKKEDHISSSCCCCISHLFSKAASHNPNKIAVIHASEGARICREFRNSSSSSDDDEYFGSHHQRVSPSNPSFKGGDEFFIFSQILASVESLAFRIRTLLDGGDVDDLIRPSTVPKQLNDDETSVVVVGIYMVPSAEYIVAILAVLRCGEAFLPLDPSWPKHRLLSIISSSNLALILRTSTNSSFHQTHTHQLLTSDFLADQTGSPVLQMSIKDINISKKKHSGSLDLAWPCQSINKRKFCYLIYTSGSTGKPKGVCGTSIGLLNRHLWMQELFPLQEEDILLFKTSTSFIDHLQEFLSAILTSIPVVIPPFEEFKLNPFYIVDFLKAYCISRLIIVPSVMRAILPALQNSYNICVQRCLKVLVFSGEILPVSLWDVLHKLLPKTSILNLYGSTEVSGDCTYFDCKRLPMILETELLSSVPIGIPISNCDIMLVGEPKKPSEGELYVGGICTSVKYFLDPNGTSLDYIELSQVDGCLDNVQFLDKGSHIYFRTGDFARRLHTGDLVFMGRKDRTLKVNGQRVALEEIENELREHPDIVDAAVIFHKGQGKLACLIAYVVLKRNYNMQILDSPIRSWLVKRLPPVMIPSCYRHIESIPMTSTGKVDYTSLSDASLSNQLKSSIDTTECDPDLLQIIKEAFADALMISEIKNDDDFFEIGGNSMAAAQVAYELGIDLKVLYIFPSPYKLLKALHSHEVAPKFEVRTNAVCKVKLKGHHDNEFGGSLRDRLQSDDESPVSVKCLKFDSITYLKLNQTSDNNPWFSSFYLLKACSFSRCNKVVFEGKYQDNDLQQVCWSAKYPRNRKGSVHDLWKVNLKSCVDASPLVVSKDGNAYLFIGSHSHTFLSIDAVSGIIHWEVKLEGRIECSAAITDDFTQVVVGCYEGKLYFLDFMTGSTLWAFVTQGEVKSQPVVDMHRKLIWCGSYDHNLYALDYKNHCCVYHISCGGSVYGSPSINMVHNMLYVASTSGRVTSISIEASPFSSMWMHELGAPVFGSLVSPLNGNVICCSVDGHVTMLSLSGSVVWKAITGGPIFAGACLSYALPSQVLICSRNGCIYSFEIEKGDLLWEYNVGDPITSSAYVDENMQLISDPSYPSDRLVCICSSSGSLYVLRINLDACKETEEKSQHSVRLNVLEFAKIDLPGEIFSSPVMIGGRMFVGCRDDFVHCLKVDLTF